MGKVDTEGRGWVILLQNMLTAFTCFVVEGQRNKRCWKCFLKLGGPSSVFKPSLLRRSSFTINMLSSFKSHQGSTRIFLHRFSLTYSLNKYGNYNLNLIFFFLQSSAVPKFLEFQLCFFLMLKDIYANFINSMHG